MGRLDNRVAIITGAASGMGRAASVLFAQEGATVVSTDINEDGLKATIAEVEKAGGTGSWVHHDVADEADWIAVIEHTVSKYGKVDALFNNAGMVINKSITDITLAEFQKQNSVNVDGVYLGIKHGILAMEKCGGGAIVNTSSIAGIVGLTLNPAYCGSKGAVRLLTKACALECAQKKNNIRINSVHPGAMQTAMMEQTVQDLGNSDEIKDMLKSIAPLGHFGEAIDIAYGALYLLSDEAKYVTGSELVIDGGFVAG